MDIYQRRETRKRNRIHYVHRASFENYIRRCLERFNLYGPGSSLSAEAVDVLDSILFDVFHQVAAEAKQNMVVVGKRTLMVEDVQFAVLRCFKGELARHAVVEGRKSVEQYDRFVHQ